MDPITALAVGGIGWLATQAAEGVAGGVADRTFTSAVRSLRDRVPALAGTPAGDDLARGLRRAQLRALERLIVDYRDTGLLSKLAPADPFVEQALTFCRSSPPLPLRLDPPYAPGSGLPALVPADGAVSVATGAALVEDAVLAELRTAMTGTSIPERFAEHYRNGGSGRRGFLHLFGIYFAEQIKEDAAFREVLHTRLLLQTAANFAELWNWLARVDERLAALDRVESGVGELAIEQRVRLSAIEAKQDAILDALAAEKGLPTAPLRAILDRLGEAGVPDDQIPTRLAAKADEYLALREQWSKVGEATPDVDAVRAEALELIEAGDLDGARQLFADARNTIRAAREQRAREEAALLAGEAEIDRLQLRYLAAADRYAEAEVMVALFDADARFNYLCKRASILRQLGEELGDNRALVEAVELWKEAADLRQRRTTPLGWALIQNNLGNALSILGERESGAERLVQAVNAYRAALEVRTREGVPLDWAATQNNLGNALQALGQRESGTERLEEAVEAYHAALKEHTRERVPFAWAMTQNNLGTALQALGQRESGTEQLERAVQSYRAALEERTRERVPLDWAMTQNNLGIALQALGQRESGTERLLRAVQAYRAALEERTRNRVPLNWAATQSNLGNALQILGQRESGTERLEEAVEAYRAALKEYTRERVPLDWAMTQNNLGNALQALGEREGGTERLEEAIEAYRAALKEHTRERVPLAWAMTQNNLGNALQALGERGSDTERLTEAVEAYRAALEERTRERVPLDWAMTQNNLGNALQTLGEHESDTERLEEAVEAFRAALEENTRERVPLDWAITQNNLGNALLALGERERGTEGLVKAVEAYRAALDVFEVAGAEYYIAGTRVGFEDAQALLEERVRGSD